MGLLNSSTQIFANNDSGVGTVGGFFKFKDEGIFGITNNHVIANANDCNIGDAVYQYGTNALIGTLQHWVTLESSKVNYLDIALFKLYDSVQLNWVLPDGSATPGEIVATRTNDKVSMLLADGSVRTGKVTVANIAHNMPFNLCGKKFSVFYLLIICHAFPLFPESGIRWLMKICGKFVISFYSFLESNNSFNCVIVFNFC